ncbi:MAG: bifunctional riboflavin kinase/FAD synthetase [Roseburia sp.]|nr:bifunctional riboflavin kinase/FAD synthetase [Roseburia sp.]
MEIISGALDFWLEKNTAVAIGKFDGIHIGHRRLIKELLSQKDKGLLACVFTFDPPPAVLFGQADGGELTTKEEKRRIFEELGIDILIEFPLTRESAAIEPETFVEEILVGRMRTKYIAAGADLSFGAGGRGNAGLLCGLSERYGFAVETIDKVCVRGEEVSSTCIRALLEEGNMETAAEYLGIPYRMTGKVVHGKRIGHTLGFPTVNLVPEAEKLLPPFGVYFTKIWYKGRAYDGVSNIGCKPTVTEKRIIGVETYLYDFSEEIYGEEITVFFHAYRRPERRFESLEALAAQLQEDMAAGEKYWESKI